MENIENLLKELTSAIGVSGEEENIVKLLTEKLEAYGDVSVDDMNNGIAHSVKAITFYLMLILMK